MTSETAESPIAADLVDERLIGRGGVTGGARSLWNRIRGGDLGMLPVIIGLIVISLVFYAMEPIFLSSRNLVSITQFAAPVGIIALGIVLVLLLGEIDLSVGSVSGMAAAVMAVVVVRQGHDMALGLVAGILSGLAVGLFYAILYNAFGIPSFVFSLAGLLGFEGVLYLVLGKEGSINLPEGSNFVQYVRYEYLPQGAAYALVVLLSVGYLTSRSLASRSRERAGLSSLWMPGVLIKAGLMLVGLLFATYYLYIDRGWGYLWVFFVLLVMIVDFALRRTTWGRHVFAIGGSEDAARRAGIKVGRTYVSVFVMCSTLAALGGLLAAAQVTSVSQSSGTGDTNLTAIAAAVIGGTSLFGGRGSAWSALLGILVLKAIQSGLNMVGVDSSSVRLIVTGGVLLLAVAVDSKARQARESSGRG
ncbi:MULTISPECIES: sugar ABC transporter permease [unclassified Nocardioides]|uniref:sugar ABC transporter permease n=1 Tax=unclassified Nocardioides TaxID=2615069 RepID=UPI0006F51D13|nr:MULTISPECIES: ABC transporter permease [unclassified Nocardioides]KQY56550.1 ABC transporter permease [Nocardioides sp. Root140]KQZ75304.1 ABC transporter permease [Nocardioides sp. Root151]KRF14384.1 ABC transporter permease [Nocardioides sp. Soil796]